MQIDLNGKTALVTGGSRGIGRAIAVRLAECGARVAVNYVRNRAAAQETAEQIRQAGGEALTLRANVGRRDRIEEMFRVGNSGIKTPAGRLTEPRDVADVVLSWSAP